MELFMFSVSSCVNFGNFVFQGILLFDLSGQSYFLENVLRQIDIRVPVSSLACNELGSPDSHLQNKKKAKQTGSQQSFLHQSEN